MRNRHDIRVETAPDLLKYPRTPHLKGSRPGWGEENDEQIAWGSLQGHYLVVEEKLDGSNCALRYDAEGTAWLQSRGHYLLGGPREGHFGQLKSWESVHREILFSVLGTRYVMYGEWLAVAHTIFYDMLPHYFFEFDIFDTERGVYLDTKSRHAMLRDTPVMSVPVLYEGTSNGKSAQVTSLVTTSLYKSANWREHAEVASVRAHRPRWQEEVEDSDLAEGVYVKDERDGIVIGRYKWVRGEFIQHITDDGTHWLERSHLANRLGDGIDLYSFGAS